MRKVLFERKDGSEGYKFKLESGDMLKITSKEVRETLAFKFPKYNVNVITRDNEVVSVDLTATQAKVLKDVGSIEGKFIQAYEYENQFGKQVGIKVTVQATLNS